MIYFFRVMAFLGLIFSISSAANAAEIPTSIEGRLLLLESQQKAMVLDFQNLRCLQAGGSEMECRQESYQLDAAAQNVTEKANAIQTSVNGTAIPSMTTAQNAILNCASAIQTFGTAGHSTQQMSQAAETAFSGQCSEENLQQTIGAAAQDVKEAAESCLEGANDIAGAFTNWEAQAQTDSLVDVLKVAAADANRLKDGAEACIDDARKAAESLDNSADALMNAVAATAAFCTAVPEPYSCAIFGAIQLLMALFSSGDGGGGDGKGPGDQDEDGTGGGTGQETVDAVAEGSGCNNVRREGTALQCDGFEFKYAFGRAVIDVNGGNAGKQIAEKVAEQLAANNGSFANLFGNGKMVARGSDQIQFCIHRLPGLPNQFFPDQWAPNGFDDEAANARVLVVFELTDPVRRAHSMSLFAVSEDDLAKPGCAAQ
ncbi:hypothetical protein [uncultured Litoreibacter sp.]|uniref:hypothetical protein n=1 Tax=uncultured Litoreibacter sp. TaxID=1392394 RepID=UPI002614755E|nr:hypothetical protein [uncultured Litoreibacter sp.]